MNHWKIFAVVGALVYTLAPCVWAQSSAPDHAPTSPANREFVVFDGTLYRNKPDFSHYGIRSVKIVAGQLWDRGKPEEGLPHEAQVHRVANEVAGLGDMVILDIEHWSLQGQARTVEGSLSKYLTVLRWFREAKPDVTVGYYGTVPIRDYWRAIKDSKTTEHEAWRAENDHLGELAAAVDVLFPSLYTFYNDREGWKKFAIAQIAEARRYGGGKPVYVFLWPEFHDSNRLLKGTYLSASFWQLQLETAKAYADGVVIWGGWGLDNRPQNWNELAEWWQVTKSFLARLSQGDERVSKEPLHP